MRDIFIISASKCKHHFNLNKKFPLPSSMVLFTFPSFVKQISVKSLSDILPPSAPRGLSQNDERNVEGEQNIMGNKSGRSWARANYAHSMRRGGILIEQLNQLA
jgi:hypothetical protein